MARRAAGMRRRPARRGRGERRPPDPDATLRGRRTGGDAALDRSGPLRFDRNALAAGAFALIVVLLGNRHFPAALPVVLLGLGWAIAFGLEPGELARSFDLRLPAPHVPTAGDVAAGFVLLALPQIPLSLGNSVLATRQLVHDLFPERTVTVRRIGLTYALMNLVNPWLGGVPTCHGSGGMAGHYAFGGRTGGSVVIYGSIFVALGLCFGTDFDRIAGAFPLPVLGVLLLFEALALVWLIRDTAPVRGELPIAALVGLVAVGLPYGYVVGMIVGTVLAKLGPRVRLVASDPIAPAPGNATREVR